MYEKYYDLYMRNMVTLVSLGKLVKAGMLDEKQVEQMIADRKKEYDY